MKRTRSDRIVDVIIAVVVTFICILCLYPMLHVLAASFSDPMRLMNHQGIMLWPDGWSLDGYKAIMRNKGLWTGYLNTIIYVVFGTAINMVMTIIGAYVLSRKGYRWKKAITFFIVFTMYFSGGMIPTYLLIKNLGLLNNFLVYLLPCMVTGFALIITRNFFMTIPDALEESAKIDGASNFTILLKIYLPLATPVIATIALWYCVQHWNSWMDNMLYVSDQSLYVLQYLLQTILNSGQTPDMEQAIGVVVHTETMKMAALVLSLIPIVCLYPFLQKYFIKGMIVGSVKG